MTNIDAFLAHYGVKGMRWGVRRASTPRASRRERLETAYRTKMSDIDAKKKAAARIRTEKILITAGAIAVTAAVAAVVGKKLHSEFAPLSIKAGSSLQNVNDRGSDFDLNRITFATFKKRDNAVYRDKFAKEVASRMGSSGKVYANELKAVKDLKIPSKAQTKKLFQEWEKTRGITPPQGQSILTRMVNNNRGSQISGNKLAEDSFLSYVGKKGFDGIQDVMDQRNGYSAKAPLMFVNGAQALVYKGSELLKVVLDD